jgi:thymidylate kinase
LGPDGVGKTTICSEVKKRMKNLFFRKIYVYHSHPGFIPKLRDIYSFILRKRVVETSFTREKKVSFLRYFLYLVYYGFENFIFWPRILWLRLRRSLIVFDRYFYDFLAVKRNSKFLFWTISKIIPRPDLIFIIEASPEKIYERKKELNIEEIKRRLILYKSEKLSGLAPVVFINSEKSLNDISAKIEKEVAKKLLERHDKL